jgi:hypothetical protein
LVTHHIPQPILQICEFHFLLSCTWSQNNELIFWRQFLNTKFRVRKNQVNGFLQP